jgi:hypothetical protein
VQPARWIWQRLAAPRKIDHVVIEPQTIESEMAAIVHRTFDR